MIRLKDLGVVLMVSLATPRQSAGARIAQDVGRAYGNMIRAATGVDPFPPAAPAAHTWTPTGIRERLYETYRARWIATGDLDALQQMISNVR